MKSIIRLLALLLASLPVHRSLATEPTNILSHPAPYPVIGLIERLDPAFDKIVPADAKIEKLAEGFTWSEGPVWVADRRWLLFSDTRQNTVYRFKEGEGVTVFMTPAGYFSQPNRGGEMGTNGLTLDPKGRLTLCEHGERRIGRLESLDTPDAVHTPLAERFDGKRLSSPNDLCYDAAGNCYFTDPPYGLVNDKAREIEFNGVYRVTPEGNVTLLTKEIERPNGIALAPDQKTLYVANSHGPRPVVTAFPLQPDGTLGPGKVFVDLSKLPPKRRGTPDGLKVMRDGTVLVAGPGGVLFFDLAGKHIGSVLTGVPTANCALADGGDTLYMTANRWLCRVKLAATPPPAKSAASLPFYAMDTAFKRGGLSDEQQIDVVKELGFDGIAGTICPPQQAVEMADRAAKRGLKLSAIYCPAKVTADGNLTYKPLIADLIAALKGRGTIIWLHIGGAGPAFDSLTGSEPLIKSLRELADLAAANDLRIAIYPHVGEWTARFGDAVKLAKLVNHPRFGVTFNLCHALAMGEDQKIPALLEESKPVLFTVTICGADAGVTGPQWNRLIRPLGQGSYDTAIVLGKLREIGFTGPVGFQGFAIPGDTRAILTPTIAAWRKLSAAPD